jgi:uncharacterized protein DUF6098
VEVIGSLERLAEVVEERDGLFVRWSEGPDVDTRRVHSRDGLTGARLPGLSANPLDVEPWWGDRSTRLWVARRLHDYSHLKHSRCAGTRPWVLEGTEVGRGPDNEPLVECRRPVAFIDDKVLTEAADVMAETSELNWGPLDRGDRRDL